MPSRSAFFPVFICATLALTLLGVFAAPAAQATFPGEDGRIVFKAGTKFANTTLYSINPDGTELRQLSQVGFGMVVTGGVSPDSREVAFTGETFTSSELYRADIDGPGRTKLLSAPAAKPFALPFWLGDGRIGFHSASAQGGTFIEAITRSGGERQTLLAIPRTSTYFPPQSVRLSPDGMTFVAAEIDCTQSPAQPCSVQLKLLNRDGSVRGTAPLPLSYISHIGWSPDGKRLVLTKGSSPKDFELYLVNADGTGLQRLTAGNDAAWSPDSRQIAFTRYEPYKNRSLPALYAINVDGTGERQLLGSRWQVSSPDWSSAPTLPPSPSMRLSAGKRQRLGKSLRGSATCELDCTLRVGATISIRRANRLFKTRRVKLDLLGGQAQTFRLKFSAYAVKAIRRLSKGKRQRVAITVEGKDLAGSPLTAQRTIRVRR